MEVEQSAVSVCFGGSQSMSQLTGKNLPSFEIGE